MGRKAREGSVNLYYLKNKNDKKEKPVSKTKNNLKKNVATQKKNSNRTKSNEKKFNFDDEFVIGVTKIQDNSKKEEKKKKQLKTSNKMKNSSKTKKVQAKVKDTKKKGKRGGFKVFKYIFLTCAVIGAIICFMLSPVFNITEIKVNGNNKLSQETIVSISGVQIGENIYKTNKKNIISNVKQNAYVDGVTIKRKIPSVLEINIKERQATYMLEYVNGYAYINNQGYILEISDVKLDKPIIVGITTNAEEIKVGNRLLEEDLIKLEGVLKIMESAASNEIEMLITKIDISNKTDYKLYMETEGKTVRLGDITDMSTKMLHVKAILEKEVGIEGEIVVDSVAKDSKSRFIQKIN